MPKVFRLQQSVPDVYARKSRDFQMLCNLFDILFGSIKNDIDSMTDILDARTCSERLLSLLQTKLGFFSSQHITNEELRVVL